MNQVTLKNEKAVNKVISLLYLTNSDYREETLSNFIKVVLYGYNEPISIESIVSLIEVEFDFIPIKNEVKSALDALILETSVKVSNDLYSLSNEERQRFHVRMNEGKLSTKNRLDNYVSILKELDDKINDTTANEIVSVFMDYIHVCFLHYGRDAIEMFFYSNRRNDGENAPLKEAKRKLQNQPENIKFLEKLINTYIEKIDSTELSYLENLSKRTELLFSLGVSKEDYEQVKDIPLMDWTLMVDTNVLYSILDLRPHPEKEACIAVLEIAKELPNLNIKFSYLPNTLIELKNASEIFDKYIIRDKLSQNQIRVMIDSNNLDTFSSYYYEQKLKNDEFAHPSDKINFADSILKGKKIDIFRTKYEKELEADGKYLQDRYSEYYDYVFEMTKIRDAKGLRYKETKDAKKVEHDIFLREVILAMREKQISFDKIKVYGLTVDKDLISFDRMLSYQNYSKSATKYVPTFIKPSFLLKKLQVFKPIETKDYKKFFIKCITNEFFENGKDEKKSILTQKSVKFFKKLGIDDISLMLECVKSEVFLGYVENENEEETKIFIQSAEDRKRAKLEEANKSERDEKERIRREKSDLEIVLSDKNKKIDKQEQEFYKIIQEKELLKFNLETKNSNLINLQNEKMKAETENKNQISILENEALRLKREIEKRDFIDNETSTHISKIENAHKEYKKFTIFNCFAIGSPIFIALFSFLYRKETLDIFKIKIPYWAFDVTTIFFLILSAFVGYKIYQHSSLMTDDDKKAVKEAKKYKRDKEKYIKEFKQKELDKYDMSNK